MSFVLGLTGSIAMGKSTTSDMFRSKGLPVFDADAVVRQMRESDPRTINALKKAFPDYWLQGKLNTAALGAQAFNDPIILKKLENIFYPDLRAKMHSFIFRHRLAKTPIVVLDIPKLFESGLDQYCDGVAVVAAPDFVQRQRVMSRPNMTAQKLKKILTLQMPTAEKCAQADFVLQTGLGRAYTYGQVTDLVAGILEKADA